MISAKNVSAGYGGVDVIKNISFEVGDCESLCIAGPNGCGKTTLLKAIAQLISYRGDITVNGNRLNSMKRKGVARHIAMLSQIESVYFTYSIYDTVMLGRYLHMKRGFFNSPESTDKEAVKKCLDTVDLWRIKDKKITELSGGQLQRVFLARTLAQEPQIILLDEPTNHLDLKYQIELIDYLKEWCAEGGRSIIGVLHDINLALSLTDNFLFLKEGVVCAYGKADDILTGSLLQQVYDTDIAGYMRQSLTRWERFA